MKACMDARRSSNGFLTENERNDLTDDAENAMLTLTIHSGKGQKQMAAWIWKFGDFEKYHGRLVHTRRQNYGYLEPPVWKLYSPDACVRFRKKIRTEGGMVSIHATGAYTVSLFGEQFLPFGEQKLWGSSSIALPAGEYVIQIRVMAGDTFAALYLDGAIETDRDWEADDTSGAFTAVGCSSLFPDPEKPPVQFPFQEEAIAPAAEEMVQTEAGENGILYDFGRECFGRIVMTDLPENCGKIRIRFGESREEALDPEWCVIRREEVPEDGTVRCPACAFRYVFLTGDDPVALTACRFTACTEMLPVNVRASFSCENALINQVFDVAEYTFHLNCREFILDGIKRDGWVWSADAYQSFFVNHYLYRDQELEKRTLTELGGGLPVVQYINTIMDYSYFWIMSLWEYYSAYRDEQYLHQIFPQAKAVMEFCNGRRSEDGFIRGQGEDCVFIDWAPMDKEGALCGEQILLAKAMDSFAKICELLGKDGSFWKAESMKLKDKILAFYRIPEESIFMDSFESGKKNITRHTNTLAYLFLGLAEEEKSAIYRNVILNPEIRQITTPYFKFYENMVRCEEGDLEDFLRDLTDYYGAMLSTGATTLYEQFDPSESGAEHYQMYGRPFEKSLCHAWSCSPIYLLQRYVAGVQVLEDGSVIISPAAADPAVRNVLGVDIRFAVPVREGLVHVHLAGEHGSIEADAGIRGEVTLGKKHFRLQEGTRYRW